MTTQLPSTNKPLYSPEPLSPRKEDRGDATIEMLERGDTILDMMRQRMERRDKLWVPKGGLPPGPARDAHEALAAKVEALRISVDQLRTEVTERKHEGRAIPEEPSEILRQSLINSDTRKP